MDFKPNVIMDYRNYRLGNLLREVKSGKVIEVIGLKKSTEKLKFPTCNVTDFEVEFSGSFPDGWQAEEIMLTPDVFLQLGFKPGNDKYYTVSYFKGLFGFWSNGREWFFSNCGTMEPIYYIHELQNIYFMYHREELNVSALNPEPIPQP